MSRSLWMLGCLCAAALPAGSCGGTNRAGGGSGTDRILTATVDASGATLRLGDLTLIIPAGALDAPTTITIAEVEDAPRGAVGAAFDLGPDGLEFRVPATLLIAYDDADLPPGTDPHGLRLSVLDRGRWAPVEGRANDSATRTVRAPLGHFSIYGIVAEPRSVAGQGTRLEANGVVLEASAPVYGRLFVSPYYLSAYLDAGAAGDVTVTFSGLPTDADTYAYLGSYAEERLVRAADGGRARFTLDLRDPVLVWFQPAAGTTFIGGPLDECGTVGVRDGNVCRLTSDIVGSVQLMTGTLDCDGHAIRQAFPDRETGIGVFIGPTEMAVGIRNCTIGGVDSQFAMGVDGFRADRPFVTDNRIEQNLIGVRFVSTTSGSVVRNVVAGSDLWSIALWDASARNEIANNSLPGDHGGITMDGVHNDPTANTGNAVRDNTISGGSAGFLFQNAQGNEVRHNDRDGGSAGLHIYPSGWPNRVYWNNFVGWTWLGVLVAEGVPDMPIDISHDGKGNHWGRTCPGPLFTPGVDSNRANVGDSYAYGAPSAWLAGVEPGCVGPDTTPPDPPVIRSPAAGDTIHAAAPSVMGAAEPDSRVTVFEGPAVLARGLATADGEFGVVTAVPLSEGWHTIHATATDQSGNESLPSAPVRFFVRPVSMEAPLVGEAGRLEVVELVDFPDPFEPAEDVNTLRVVGRVRRVAGLGGGSPNHRFLALVERTIRDMVTGAEQKTTLGFVEIPNVPGTGEETAPVTVADHWCGTDAAGNVVARGQGYSYDLSLRVIRQYVGPGRGPRCSRGETVLTTGPGAPACLVDSLQTTALGVVNVAPAAVVAEPAAPYCYRDLLALTDKARALIWPDLVHPRWYFTGALESVWGEDFSITPGGIGCSAPSREDQAACVLAATSAFGIRDPAAELRHVRTETTDLGYTLVRFQQYARRWPVQGAQVLVTFSPAGAITRVVSSFIPDLRVVNSARGVFEEDFARFDRARAVAAIVAELERLEQPTVPAPTVSWDVEEIFVNHAGRDPRGRLAVGATVAVGGSIAPTHRFVVDVADGRVLAVAPTIIPQAAVLDSELAYPEFSSIPCSDWPPPPRPCSPPYTYCPLRFGLIEGWCVRRCTSALECAHYDPSWQCVLSPPWPETTDQREIGLCHAPPGDPRYAPPTIVLERVYRNGWTVPEYQWYPPYSKLAATLEEVKLFFATDLGRLGWADRADRDFLTYLVFNTPGEPGIRTSAFPTGIFWAWPSWLLTERVLDQWGRRHDLMHEWTHTMVGSITTGSMLYDGSDCLGEGLSDLYGSLLAVKHMGRSSTRWPSACDAGLEGRMNSPWGDDTYGLRQCVRRHVPPYAARSFLDRLPCSFADRVRRSRACTEAADCLPYDSCEGAQCWLHGSAEAMNARWTRFARILTEGAGTFVVDGTGETIWPGGGFAGIELDATINVIYRATRDLTPASTLFSWVDSLVAAGWEYGVRETVRYALGAVGFLSGPFRAHWGPTGPDAYASDAGVVLAEFRNWTLGPLKWFYAWKDRGGMQLRVGYYLRDRGKVLPVPGANTLHRPALVEYAGRLYIFWRDAPTGRIRFVRFRGDSHDLDEGRAFDLGWLGLSSSGAFDAVVFGGDLYLVYADPPGNLIVARCIAGERGCDETTHSWRRYDGEHFFAIPGEVGWAPGMAAVAAWGLNGVAAARAEYLYVFGAMQRAGYERRLRLVQIDTDLQVAEAEYVPGHYPSTRSADPVAVVARQSAFPVGNYLYLAWNDAMTGEMHLSVVQTWDDTVPGDADDVPDDDATWFTRSARMNLRMLGGPSWLRGGFIEDAQATLAVSQVPGGAMRYLYLWGRY